MSIATLRLKFDSEQQPKKDAYHRHSNYALMIMQHLVQTL